MDLNLAGSFPDRGVHVRRALLAECWLAYRSGALFDVVCCVLPAMSFFACGFLVSGVVRHRFLSRAIRFCIRSLCG